MTPMGMKERFSVLNVLFATRSRNFVVTPCPCGPLAVRWSLRESFMERRTVKYSAGLLECCRREGQKGRAVCLGERLEVPLVIDWKDGFQLLLL